MPIILCERREGYYEKQQHKKKNDDRILLQIKDKDCVAIEVRYHRKCYTNYTNFLHRQEKKASDGAKYLYDAGYEQFCKEVVEELINKKQITFMSHLYSKFVKIVRRVEGLDASGFGKFRLKERLTRSYPQLVFVTPKRRSVKLSLQKICVQRILWEMIMIYISAVEVITMMIVHWMWNMEANKPMSDARVLNHASMLLKKTISSTQGLQVPWLPVASDITIENV